MTTFNWPSSLSSCPGSAVGVCMPNKLPQRLGGVQLGSPGHFGVYEMYQEH